MINGTKYIYQGKIIFFLLVLLHIISTIAVQYQQVLLWINSNLFDLGQRGPRKVEGQTLLKSMVEKILGVWYTYESLYQWVGVKKR